MSCSFSTLLRLPEKSPKLVRPRGLEPPRVAPLAPQASASTNSATTADGLAGRIGRAPKARRRCNKSVAPGQGRRGASPLVGRPRQHLGDLDGDAVAADDHGSPG